jgi:hypothetical protein
MYRFTLLLLSSLLLPAAPAVSFDIVYVRAPRYGDQQMTRWAEVFHPTFAEPGSHLMLLHPDGSEELLFDAGHGAVLDPVPSLDGKSVYFSWIPDVRREALNYQRGDAPRGGADIYRIHVATREVVRLTHQEWNPATGSVKWSANPVQEDRSQPGSYHLGYGIFNLGACPLPGGRVMFVSSRDGYLPHKSFTFPNLRLYVMDEDGNNVEAVGHMNLGSALHPTLLQDGRVVFSTYESQGLRDDRVWSLWTMQPDGRGWEPLKSAFRSGSSFHFQTQLSDGRIAVTEYYNLNNSGFGTLLAFRPPAYDGSAAFGPQWRDDPGNPRVHTGRWFFSPGHPYHLQPRYTQYSFSPPGLENLTPFAHGEDNASSLTLTGDFAGKVTHPASAPGNDVLLVYTPGPANHLMRPVTTPRVDGGIYLLRSGASVEDPRNLVLIRNSPDYNEIQPRALVAWKDIYGSEAPELPWLPNDGNEHSQLPAGTPFGLVGSSSLTHRNTGPAYGPSAWSALEPFNTTENEPSSNWFTQGAEAGRYSDSDIVAVRILQMEADAHRSYGPEFDRPGFRSHNGRERLRVLGEINVRKTGSDDTSFLAKIPADTPFTFQTLDRRGMVLNMAQTWHMVRPGEARTNCGGCHAHAEKPQPFSGTAASQSSYTIADLTAPAKDVEFHRDVLPILQRSCAGCHNSATSPQRLNLLDDGDTDGYSNVWHRLANDGDAKHGLPPVIRSGNWRFPQASRYVRRFQSRRSLLLWKIFGERLDGWRNEDFPTESADGDRTTLPAGSDSNMADLDYKGTLMPPPDSGAAPLSGEEKRIIARWIDLGAPASSRDTKLSQANWFVDDLKPTLALSSPRAGRSSEALRVLRVGAWDSTSGLDENSLSVKASFPVAGRAAGEELADLFQPAGTGIRELRLNEPLRQIKDGTLWVAVMDKAGNMQKTERRFSIMLPQ